MLVLVIGQLGDEQMAAVQVAADRTGVRHVLRARDAEEVAGMLRHLPESPRCFLAASSADVAVISALVDDEAVLHGVPIVMLSSHPNGAAYQKAYDNGAEDVIVGTDVGALVRRLANLRHYDPRVRPAANRGCALIASEDMADRNVVGRALRKAGFDISFAAGATELLASHDGRPIPDFVVASAALFPAVEASGLGSGASPVPATVIDAGGASTTIARKRIDQLLFWVDEHVGNRGSNQRKSPRVMSASMCTFRLPTSFEPTYAMTHDLSGEGLYIRTLDPPPSGSEVWLELRDGAAKLLQLRGEVVWRRAPSQAGGSAPIGFGVRLLLDATPSRDYARYLRTYDEALRDEAGQQDLN